MADKIIIWPLIVIEKRWVQPKVGENKRQKRPSKTHRNIRKMTDENSRQTTGWKTKEITCNMNNGRQRRWVWDYLHTWQYIQFHFERVLDSLVLLNIKNPMLDEIRHYPFLLILKARKKNSAKNTNFVINFLSGIHGTKPVDPEDSVQD